MVVGWKMDLGMLSVGAPAGVGAARLGAPGRMQAGGSRRGRARTGRVCVVAREGGAPGARELKAALVGRGLDTSDCFERADLEAKARGAGLLDAEGRLVARDGAGGAGGGSGREGSGAKAGAAGSGGPSKDAASWAARAGASSQGKSEKGGKDGEGSWFTRAYRTVDAKIGEAMDAVGSPGDLLQRGAEKAAAWNETTGFSRKVAEASAGAVPRVRRVVMPAWSKVDNALGVSTFAKTQGPKALQSWSTFKETPTGTVVSFGLTMYLIFSGWLFNLFLLSVPVSLALMALAPETFDQLLTNFVSDSLGGGLGADPDGLGGSRRPPQQPPRRPPPPGGAGDVIDVDAETS